MWRYPPDFSGAGLKAGTSSQRSVGPGPAGPLWRGPAQGNEHFQSGPAHAYIHAVMALPAARAPGLTAALRTADARYVLLDGTLAACDRVDDSRADYSDKHRKHGVNLQVVTAPDGTLVWISPALTGRIHSKTPALTASRHCTIGAPGKDPPPARRRGAARCLMEQTDRGKRTV